MNRQQRQRSKRNAKTGEDVFEGMAVQKTDVAGIDIGSDKHYVSVPPDRDEVDVRSFGCYTPDLLAMAEWLKSCRVTSVVMESTGVYWVPAFQVLSEAGFDVQLVDAHYAKNVPGRKTDVWDAKWLRKLHTFGMLRGCFIPPAQVLELRTYWRHRVSLVEACSQQVLRIQKALEQMNLQLHKAISDIAGMTGMRILRAIVAGERDPVILARMRDGRIKASEEEIVKALTGHYLPVHVFALKQALAIYDCLHAQMQECDQQIRACMARFEDASDADPAAPMPTECKRSRNALEFQADVELKRIFGVDLTRIEGIGTQTAMAVLTECGPDVSKFPTPGHFSSWLGVCPNNRITGGHIKSNRTRKVSNRLAWAFRLAAQSLCRSQTAMGAFYRRIAARHGAPKAITATAHKLARLVYMMLTRGEEYVAVGQTEYEKQYQEQRVRNLRKQAALYGFGLVDATTGAIVS